MTRDIIKTLAAWRGGIRLYLAAAIWLVTVEVWWWAEVSYGGSVLFATRLEEVYAWLALGLLGLAVAIGPVYNVWPRLPGKKIMRDARRLIGVGTAWFASLHVGIAYVSLFKAANPLRLPRTYQQAFALGVTALVILLAMALTSFDGAFRALGSWWFRLHRLVYAAIVLSLLHALMIGVHARDRAVLAGLASLAVIILGLHGYLAFVRRRPPSLWQVLTIGSMFVLLAAVLAYGYQHA